MGRFSPVSLWAVWVEEAREFCREFFAWYNEEHRHGGIGLMTPAAVQYARTPEPFVRRPLRPPKLPSAAWINKPATEEVAH